MTRILVLVAVLGVLMIQPGSASVNVSVDVQLDRVVNVLDERYLSVALEASIFKKAWATFNIRSARLHTLVSALSPAYLRVGGSSCDFLYFNSTGKHRAGHHEGGRRRRPDREDDGDDEQGGHHKIQQYFLPARLSDEDFEGDVFLEHHKNYTNFTMTAHDWDGLHKFARRSGLRILFDLNVFARRQDGSWDSSNARELLEYSIERNYTSNLDLELGNEPSAYPHAFNRTITAAQLGQDMMTLMRMVRHDFGPHFMQSLLVGPDITRPKQRSLTYLKEYLNVVQRNIQAITWHQYYVDGRTATADDFLSPTVLDYMKPYLVGIQGAANATGLGDVPLWMGETSSAWGGGARGLSDRFIAGFMWLDKLGLAAQYGQKVVTRQSLYGGHYALLDDAINPLPDYWLSVLFKRLVGRQVFQTQSSSKDVRVYAHCTAEHTYRSGSFNAGSLTLFGLNVGSEDAVIQLPESFNAFPITKYILTSGKKKLTTKSVRLNGRKLKLLTDYLLPKMSGKRVAPGAPLILPKHALAFYVIDAEIKLCNTPP